MAISRGAEYDNGLSSGTKAKPCKGSLEEQKAGLSFVSKAPHRCSEILRSVRNLLGIINVDQILKRSEHRNMVLHVLMLSQ